MVSRIVTNTAHSQHLVKSGTSNTIVVFGEYGQFNHLQAGGEEEGLDLPSILKITLALQSIGLLGDESLGSNWDPGK